MNKKDLIDVIVIAVLLSILVIFNYKLSADNSKKDNRINELEQQVEEQYYVIDALKQQEERMKVDIYNTDKKYNIIF